MGEQHSLTQPMEYIAVQTGFVFSVLSATRWLEKERRRGLRALPVQEMPGDLGVEVRQAAFEAGA